MSYSNLVRNTLLTIFFIATPLTQYCVYVLGKDRVACAIANGYGFSIPMVLLYVYPFLQSRPWTERIKAATINWIIWLSVFTEIIFQIPHNLLVRYLHDLKGSAIEWPFYSYGLSDSRWNDYSATGVSERVGLEPVVWLINCNDAILGILVLTALLYYRWCKKTPRESMSRVILVLCVVFRDATLWRETVEYMFDHHTKGYPYTTNDSVYRVHAIALLWIVNGVWLIAPVTSLVWGYNEIESMLKGSVVKRQ